MSLLEFKGALCGSAFLLLGAHGCPLNQLRLSLETSTVCTRLQEAQAGLLALLRQLKIFYPGSKVFAMPLQVHGPHRIVLSSAWKSCSSTQWSRSATRAGLSLTVAG